MAEDRTNVDSYGKQPESAHKIQNNNEGGDGDYEYNPHKKALESIFSYADQVH